MIFTAESLKVGKLAQKGLYKLLGVPASASSDDIKKAYHERAKQLHPDKNKNHPTATRDFQAIQRAYDVLIDDEKRQRYDRTGMVRALGRKVEKFVALAAAFWRLDCATSQNCD